MPGALGLALGETKEEAMENLVDAVRLILQSTAEVARATAKSTPARKGRKWQPIKSDLMELCETR